MEKVIYLDNAATTFPKPEAVYQAMDEANREFAVNAGRGSYHLARKANEIILQTKERIRELVHSKNAEVIFSSSATIAMNQIIGGLTWTSEDVVYVSPFEHNAVMRVLEQAKGKNKFKIEVLATRVDEEIVDSARNRSVVLDIDKIRYQFAKCPPTKLFICHVSNVTGYILPLEEITAIAKQYKPVFIVDGSQAFGLINIDILTLGIDFYVFAGHKTPYGPFGIGGFISSSFIKLKPFLAGGTGSNSLDLGMEQKGFTMLEPGSPNIVAIYGLLTALNMIEENELYKEQRLAEQLLNKLREVSGLVLFTPKGQKTGIVSFAIEGMVSTEIGNILDEEYGIAVRTGYHCTPLIHQYLNDTVYAGTVRISIGRFNTEQDVKVLLGALNEITGN